MEKVTAGKDKLGDFAPKFAELNDDVLFGQVWVRRTNSRNAKQYKERRERGCLRVMLTLKQPLLFIM